MGKHSVGLVFTEKSKQKAAVVVERNHSRVVHESFWYQSIRE